MSINPFYISKLSVDVYLSRFLDVLDFIKCSFAFVFVWQCHLWKANKEHNTYVHWSNRGTPGPQVLRGALRTLSDGQSNLYRSLHALFLHPFSFCLCIQLSAIFLIVAFCWNLSGYAIRITVVCLPFIRRWIAVYQ